MQKLLFIEDAKTFGAILKSGGMGMWGDPHFRLRGSLDCYPRTLVQGLCPASGTRCFSRERSILKSLEYKNTY